MGKKIRHFSHQHDLELYGGGEELPCGVCNRLIPEDQSRYECFWCLYCIHEESAEWLEYMNHSLHPLHPLKLARRSLNNNSCCYYCEEPFNNDEGYVYGCDDQQCSNFYMHGSCAVIPLLTISSDADVDGGHDHGVVQYVCHQKPMIPMENLDGKKIRVKCFACQLGWSSGSTYSCTSPACENFLHKSCAEFPRKIQHPFHLHNSLILQVSKPQLCRSCCTKNRLVFSCLEKSCTFNLGVECASLDITVKCQSHDHSLSLVEKSSCAIQCDACRKSYKNWDKVVPNEIKYTQSFMFRCMDCDFNYHFLCGPLSTTIKYEYHIHPLILSNHSVTEDGSDEYYCDVCEEERDQSFRIYYCEECIYAAHIHCLISEIMKVIKGEAKDVVLRVLGEEQWDQYLCIMESKTSDLTLKYTMDALTEQEKQTLIDPFGFDSTRRENTRRILHLRYQQLNSRFNLEGSNEDVDRLVRFFLFNAEGDTDFSNFTKELSFFTPEGSLLKLLEDKHLRQEVVDVDGYMVPKTLAPVLKGLLHKYYGDLRGWKSLSSAMKSITSTLLCIVIERMCRTKVEDITWDDLKHFNFYLGGIQRITGFNTGRFYYGRDDPDFSLKCLLGFKAIKYEKETCENLDNRIAKLEAKLERCKDNREKLRSKTHRSQMSHFINEGLSLASKWKDKYWGDSWF